MSLVLKAAALARSAPVQWREFLAELAVYVDVKKNECIQAPPEMLQVTQGRAQQLASLLTLFNNAVKDADRVVVQLERRSKR